MPLVTMYIADGLVCGSYLDGTYTVGRCDAPASSRPQARLSVAFTVPKLLPRSHAFETWQTSRTKEKISIPPTVVIVLWVNDYHHASHYCCNSLDPGHPGRFFFAVEEC
jgi:hypothetical protein